MAKDDDEVWRAIVDNYGDRAELDGDAPAEPAPDPAPEAETGPEPLPELLRPVNPAPPPELSGAGAGADTERFVPPTPPPVPATTRDRRLAWVGVFGSPAVLLVSLVLGLDLPQLVAYALVASFVGGFLYLVFKMDRGPRDPGDDGAVV